MKRILLFSVLIFCTAVLLEAQTVTKQLYLSSPGQDLDRVDPVATGDLTTAQTNTLFGSGGLEPITQVGAPASSNAPQTATTHSFGYNSGTTGTSRILLVGISYLNTNNRSISSVSYGGQAMTLVGDLNYNSGGTYYARVYIYRLTAPATGSNSLDITWNGALSQGAVVGAVTYTGVNQTNPTGTFASSSGNNGSPSVTVSGATGRLVFGVVSGQTTSAYTVTGGGTELWSSMPYSGQTAGNAQSRPGLASVNLTWNGANARWAAAGVSLFQAIKPNAALFTQSPVMCSNLIIKAGAITVTNYISIVNGSMPVNPSVSAVLKYGNTTIINLSNPIYNSGNGTLTWTGTLLADKAVPAGQAITLTVTNTQVSGDFLIEYDSQAKPSEIDLKVSTCINVNSVDVYSAVYPSGIPVTISQSGISRYLRAVVSDPFGSADITAVNFTITPTGTIVPGTLVATSGCTSTYEYAWTTPGAPGSYTINATAKEGYENTVTHSKSIIHSICNATCPPGALNDSATGSGGSPVTIDVLANDYGIGNSLDTASLTIITDPNNGTAYIASGKIIYLPNGSFSGKDTLTYQICDKSSPVPLCSIASVFLTTDPLVIDICGNASKTHTYYIPYPEQEAYTALQASTSNTMPSNDIRTIISIKTPYAGMRIVWDEWEDGYELNHLNPQQSTTKVWGDGNPYNGIAPGYPSDIIPEGGSIVLDNTMPSNPRNSGNIFYDGKDKITSSGQIAMTQVCGEPTFMPVQAIKTNITSVFDFGQSFTIPFGQDFNSDDFKYTSLFIRASQDNTTINVDKDNDATFETTTTLNEGQCLFINGGVLTGATIASDKPVGMEVCAGGIDNYSIRNSPVYPATWYSNTYYTPVPTSDNAGDNPKDTAAVMLYNSLSRPIDINWYSGAPASGVITIPENTAVRFPLAYSTTATYKFVNLTGESFTAIEIVDSYTPGGGGNNGETYDWSFNLIAESRLTDYATVAWAPGGLDLDATPGPDVNGNPIWVTPSINTTVYVKYDGNVSGAGGLTSPCGLKYDTSYTLNALSYKKIRDPYDNDQGGIAVYTCNGAKLAAVYGEDAEGSGTGIGIAYWDVGATIQPFCKQKLIFAKDDYARTLINQPVTITVLNNDGGFLAVIDPATLNTTGVLQPKHGTAKINSNATFLYTPAPGYTGIDTFEYVICSTPTPVICAKARVFVTITGCPAENNQNLISGQVFRDVNKDGIKNDNGAGFPNIKVYLYTDGNCNGIIDAKEKTDSVTVDSSGYYQFVKYPEKIIADNFDLDAGGNSCATGTDGNITWTAAWTDAGDPSAGYCNNSQTTANTDVEVINNAGFSFGLRLKDQNRSATRMVNLAGVSKAFLSFSYMKKSTTISSADIVSVQASSNGSSFTTIYTIKGNGAADNVFMPILNQDITSYISATTYIRFLTNNSMADNDTVYIDDVSIRYLNYPQCYITGIAASSIPSDAYSTTVVQRSVNISGSGSCSSGLDFGIAKNSISISGKLVNDNNALKNGSVNGPQIQNLNGTTVFVYLTDNNGKVLNKTIVTNPGQFDFPNADVNTNYKLVTSIIEVNIYDQAPAANNIPTDWVFTGEDYGTNNNAGNGVEPGAADGKLNISTGTQNINNVLIAAERLPDSDNKYYFIATPALNSFITLNGTGTIPGPLSGSDPEDGLLGATNNLHITSLPTGNNQLYYNNIQITVGQDGMNPPSETNPFIILNYNTGLLQVKFTGVGSKFTEFNYAFLDAADLRKPISAIYRLEWNNPLPVKLISFDAILKDNNKVDLTWATITETNLHHFAVERSTDGIHFSDIGIILSTGNTTTRTDYRLTDDISSVTSMIIYYRLRSVDIDDKNQYSETRIIRVSKQNENSISIVAFPNPVIHEVRISIPAEWQNRKVTYEVFNAHGQVSKKTETGSSSQTETLDMSNLAPGFYVVRVSCNDQTAQQKIVKQ